MKLTQNSILIFLLAIVWITNLCLLLDILGFIRFQGIPVVVIIVVATLLSIFGLFKGKPCNNKKREVFMLLITLLSLGVTGVLTAIGILTGA
ncbi:MAG: hypothetical protein DSY33_05425 [Archaeoglobus sp.]|jgi:hypothetical protein|nr:MAG: hypothetical protein DSY33_05425 [Archaeoglobus sp.]